jgi:hypothetical protein
MCDEYFFLRKKTSDTARKSKEQVEALIREITATTRTQESAPESEAKPAVRPEKETA